MAQKPPAFLFYAQRWLSSTKGLMSAAKGVYIDLLAWSWDNGPLPLEEKSRAKLAGEPVGTFRRLWASFADKWRQTDTGYINEPLERLRAETSAYFERQSQRGRKGADARWRKHSASIPQAEPKESPNGSTPTSYFQSPNPVSPRDQGTQGAPVPVWGHGNRHRGSGLVGNHTRCFDVAAACGRGLCIPAFLGQQWLQQLELDTSVDARPTIQRFAEGVIAALPPGPIGDEPLKFWRAAWSNRHGSQAPATSARPHGRGARIASAFDEAHAAIEARKQP